MIKAVKVFWIMENSYIILPPKGTLLMFDILIFSLFSTHIFEDMFGKIYVLIDSCFLPLTLKQGFLHAMKHSSYVF